MRISKVFAMSFVIAGLAGPGSLVPTGAAHHSTIDIYDNSQSVQITGKVIEWRLVNPHPFLIIEVTGEDGQAAEWDVSFGGSAAAPMRRRGFSVDSFTPGETIVVEGSPARSPDLRGVLVGGGPGNITREDGTAVP
jgi:hypothetical protein